MYARYMNQLMWLDMYCMFTSLKVSQPKASLVGDLLYNIQNMFFDYSGVSQKWSKKYITKITKFQILKYHISKHLQNQRLSQNGN